jgi:hypothetical protein
MDKTLVAAAKRGDEKAWAHNKLTKAGFQDTDHVRVLDVEDQCLGC